MKKKSILQEKDPVVRKTLFWQVFLYSVNKPEIFGLYFWSINLNRCDQPLNPGSSVIRRRPSCKKNSAALRRIRSFAAPPKWSSNIFVEKLKSFRIEKPISETLPSKSTKINEINQDISENMMDGSVQVYNEHRNPENYPSDYTFNQPIYATLNSHQNAQNKFGKLNYNILKIYSKAFLQ